MVGTSPCRPSSSAIGTGPATIGPERSRLILAGRPTAAAPIPRIPDQHHRRPQMDSVRRPRHRARIPDASARGQFRTDARQRSGRLDRRNAAQLFCRRNRRQSRHRPRFRRLSSPRRRDIAAGAGALRHRHQHVTVASGSPALRTRPAWAGPSAGYARAGFLLSTRRVILTPAPRRAPTARGSCRNL